MAGTHATVLPEPRSEQVHRPPRSRVIMPGLVAAEGAALAVLAGLDGSPVWRVVRVLVVTVVTAVGVWVTHRAGRAGRGAAALVAGMTGTVTGAGVASAHLAKAGLDTAAVVAAVVLVTGIVPLIWGAGALVRAVRAGGGCWPRRCPPPCADHRRPGQGRRAHRRPLVKGRLTCHSAGVGRTARRAHSGPGNRTQGVGSSRDQLPARGTGRSAMTAGQGAANTG
jgi:hypothetical protein